MDLVAGFGALAIILGCIALIIAFRDSSGVIWYATGFGMVLNGLVVIAGSQMGSAALDTAVSTRDTADAVRDMVNRQAPAPRVEERQIPGLRASR